MNSIEVRLQKILTEYGIDQNKITTDADYYFDLNLDMLDLMNLSKKIHKEFLIYIPEKEIFNMEKISDTIYLLEK